MWGKELMTFSNANMISDSLLPLHRIPLLLQLISPFLLSDEIDIDLFLLRLLRVLCRINCVGEEKDCTLLSRTKDQSYFQKIPQKFSEINKRTQQDVITTEHFLNQRPKLFTSFTWKT